jgi:RNA polymerase sigma-70 factor (TIGR02943 family)
MTERSPSEPADWIDRHGDALYGFALLQLGDPEAAEERVQETLLAALEARDSFRGQSSERTWLIGILKHKICDHFRRRARQPGPEGSDPNAAAFDRKGKWVHGPKPWSEPPQASAARAEFWAAFRRCLEAMPPRLHDAFCLRELHGLATDGICSVLDVTPNHLWTLLHRARASLRRCLEQHWFGRKE